MAKFSSLAPPSGNLALWSALAFYLSLTKYGETSESLVTQCSFTLTNAM